jgi:hypothetical protein
MRFGRLSLVAIVLAAAVAPALAQEPQEEPVPAVTSAATVDLLSHYVWRGLRLSDGFVMQPSAVVGVRGFSVNLWWNFAPGSSSGG